MVPSSASGLRRTTLPPNPLHRMTALRRRLAIRTPCRRAVIGERIVRRHDTHDENPIQLSDMNMKRKALFTVLWMLTFAALAFLLAIAVLLPLTLSGRSLF